MKRNKSSQWANCYALAYCCCSHRSVCTVHSALCILRCVLLLRADLIKSAHSTRLQTDRCSVLCALWGPLTTRAAGECVWPASEPSNWPLFALGTSSNWGPRASSQTGRRAGKSGHTHRHTDELGQTDERLGAAPAPPWPHGPAETGDKSQ